MHTYSLVAQVLRREWSTYVERVLHSLLGTVEDLLPRGRGEKRRKRCAIRSPNIIQDHGDL